MLFSLFSATKNELVKKLWIFRRMPNCIFQLFQNWKKWELATFAKITASLFVNFTFILRPFLLERRKLPLCELQLILWLENLCNTWLQKRSWLSKKIADEGESGVFWISMKICAIIEMFRTISSRHHQKFSKKILQNEGFNFTWSEIFSRTTYDNPEAKLSFFEKTEWIEKSFSHFGI